MVQKNVTVAWTQTFTIDVAEDLSVEEIEELAIKNATYSFNVDDPIVLNIEDTEDDENLEPEEAE